MADSHHLEQLQNPEEEVVVEVEEQQQRHHRHLLAQLQPKEDFAPLALVPPTIALAIFYQHQPTQHFLAWNPSVLLAA